MDRYDAVPEWTLVMNGGWSIVLIYLGIPTALLLLGLAMEYVISPAWRGMIRRLPHPWQGRVDIAPVLATIFVGLCLAVFMVIKHAPEIAALIGGSITGIGGIIFLCSGGWQGGWRSAISELTSALFIGFVVTVFIAALIVFFGGGHPIPLDERF